MVIITLGSGRVKQQSHTTHMVQWLLSKRLQWHNERRDGHSEQSIYSRNILHVIKSIPRWKNISRFTDFFSADKRQKAAFLCNRKTHRKKHREKLWAAWLTYIRLGLTTPHAKGTVGVLVVPWPLRASRASSSAKYWSAIPLRTYLRRKSKCI